VKKPNPHARALGRLGGKAGTGKAKARDPEKMRKAALKMWKAKRLADARANKPKGRKK
jgi:hypothetical protein